MMTDGGSEEKEKREREREAVFYFAVDRFFGQEAAIGHALSSASPARRKKQMTSREKRLGRERQRSHWPLRR